MSSYDDDDDDDGDDLNLLLKSGDNLFLANPKSPLRGFSGDFFLQILSGCRLSRIFCIVCKSLDSKPNIGHHILVPFSILVSEQVAFSNIIRPPPLLPKIVDYAILPVIMQFSYQLHIS